VIADAKAGKTVEELEEYTQAQLVEAAEELGAMAGMHKRTKKSVIADAILKALA